MLFETAKSPFNINKKKTKLQIPFNHFQWANTYSFTLGISIYQFLFSKSVDKIVLEAVVYIQTVCGLLCYYLPMCVFKTMKFSPIINLKNLPKNLRCERVF